MKTKELIVGLLAATFFGSGCAQDTALVVNVQALPGVHDEEGAPPVDLLVTFKSQKNPAPQEHILSAKGEFYTDPAQLKTRFSLIANDHAGPISLEVEARGVAKRPVGAGIATAILADGETVETEMTLYPSDMQVNTQFIGQQIFTSDPAFTARQLASDSQGNFVAIWEDVEQCNASEGLRCDIFGRLYDTRAVPRINGAFGTADQFVVNPNTTFYDHPAVAMQPDGSYMTVWLQSGSDRRVLSIRSFMPDGTLDANMSASEITLSTEATGAAVANPDIAALPNGNYIVAWVETTDGLTAKIRSRIVTRAGTPADGALDPTTVAPLDSLPTWLTDGGLLFVNSIGVVVAAGPDGGAMVAWSPPCDVGPGCWNIQLRPYVHGSGYGTIQNASQTGTNNAGYFDLAGLPYGYALAWGDVVSADTNEHVDVLLRRFGPDGTPLDEDGFVLNTSRQSYQGRPAISADSNGTMLVAWVTLDDSQDPEGGIRARRLMANGLPVGPDFAANTTSRGLQSVPSLAPGANGAYILLFEDGSEAGPDQLQSGIRARLLYPDYDPRDGQVGSLCSAGSCLAGMACWTMPIAGRGNEQRCVNECEGPGALCPNGGRCLQVPEQSKYLCVYNQ